MVRPRRAPQPLAGLPGPAAGRLHHQGARGCGGHSPRPAAAPAGHGWSAITPLTRDISEFAFDIDGPDGFRPGQYALLHLDGVDGGRPYSMSNLPGDGPWRFLIKRTGGQATSRLFSAAPGLVVTLDGPYGTAWLRQDCPRDLVLIAGGSGLSPMVSIARAAAATGMLADRRLHFYYGCRTGLDRVERSVILADLAADHGFVTALSEPDPGHDGPTGFLHDVVAAAMGPRLKDHEIYFAGPPAMSAAIQKMAHEAGVPPSQLHFDDFY